MTRSTLTARPSGEPRVRTCVLESIMHSHFVFAPPGKRAALLTFLLLLPAIASPGAAQPARPAVRGNRQTVQPRRGSQPAKTPETTEAAVQPPPEVPTADAPSAPGTPLVTAGELVPFNVAASKEFRVEAPTGADRLDFNFLIAGTDSLSVYVRYGQSPVDATGKIFAEHTFHEMKAASVGSISRLLPLLCAMGLTISGWSPPDWRTVHFSSCPSTPSSRPMPWRPVRLLRPRTRLCWTGECRRSGSWCWRAWGWFFGRDAS